MLSERPRQVWHLFGIDRVRTFLKAHQLKTACGSVYPAAPERYFEIVNEGCGGRARDIDLCDRQRADVRLAGQQRGSPEVETIEHG